MTPCLTLLAAAAFAATPPDSTIAVDAGKVLNQTTRLHYGSCIEDVNHEIYGGLYAQQIFGESFEEPPRFAPRGWTDYGGRWSVKDGVCSVAADAGAKILRNEPDFSDGAVECDVNLAASRADIGGLLVRVQQPRVGADSFLGYEISVNARAGRVLLGRHRNDWKLLQDAPAAVKPGAWHRLRVECAGKDVAVFLDGDKTPLITYTDSDAPILSGKVGLRTWNSDASFRRCAVETGGKRITDDFASTADSPADHVSGMWDGVRNGGAVARFDWDDDNPYNSAHSQKIEMLRGDGTAGVANRGLNRWGLSVRDGRTCAGRLYLRQAGYDGKVTVALQSADGGRTYAKQEIGPISKDWMRYEFSLKPNADDANARFTVWIDRPGAVWVDQVYLSGTGDALFHGLPMRADVGNMLVDEELGVLRYGGSMVNAPEYRWKKMIGDRDRRPQYKGWWYPNSTNGFGFEDFVQFCRAAGFECVFAVNDEETLEDAADLVEYLNGTAVSEWGKRRAANGHPEPYGVRYIEIGNEEKTDAHYIERFKLLADAMHARDPNVQLIIAAWWEPDNPVSKRIVQELDGKAALWDVHVGGDDLREGGAVGRLFTRMEKLVQEWAPGTKLKACVLEENGGRHDLQRALGHAHILNAVQRHGDFVLIDCPANCLQPWKQNDNDWDQGQVFLTNRQVWGMPPYYAQQMAAENHQPDRVAASVESPNEDLDVTVLRSEDATSLVLKVVNIGDRPHRAGVRIDHFEHVAPKADVWTLTGRLEDVNSPDVPERVKTVRSAVDVAAEAFEYEFPAYSFTILKLARRP
ncbi:MAG TPA: alpha-L-arabinofuranosidase C-terminal domain-containing protein [Gemmataceae bacterium]|nr:alpha-L-arabinofuranosidase C-terminal domain-containing protein [Gemmataceae bacterium]